MIQSYEALRAESAATVRSVREMRSKGTPASMMNTTAKFRASKTVQTDPCETFLTPRGDRLIGADSITHAGFQAGSRVPRPRLRVQSTNDEDYLSMILLVKTRISRARCRHEIVKVDVVVVQSRRKSRACNDDHWCAKLTFKIV
jgi:RNA processing factor Prp31